MAHQAPIPPQRLRKTRWQKRAPQTQEPLHCKGLGGNNTSTRDRAQIGGGCFRYGATVKRLNFTGNGPKQHHLQQLPPPDLPLALAIRLGHNDTLRLATIARFGEGARTK